MKIRRQPSCSVRTDRQTDRQTDHRTDVTKLIIAFRSFADAPKNGNHQLRVGLGVKVSYQQTREGCLKTACHVFCHVVLNMRWGLSRIRCLMRYLSLRGAEVTRHGRKLCDEELYYLFCPPPPHTHTHILLRWSNRGAWDRPGICGTYEKEMRLNDLRVQWYLG
jgi:hypothetical protein